MPISLSRRSFMLHTYAADESLYCNQDIWKKVVPANYQNRAEFAFVIARPNVPNVLLIGDSISMSYTAGVQKRLEGIANVYRAPDNCRSTKQTLTEIETYLGDMKWDVIHFNCGIHDITHLNSERKVAPPPLGQLQVPMDEYRSNIRKLVDRLNLTGAKLVWASTTPIGSKSELLGYRRDRDVVAYNATAEQVLRADEIETLDLYRIVKSRAEELLSDGVHYNAQGQAILAEAVAAAIQISLDQRAREQQSEKGQSIAIRVRLVGRPCLDGKREVTSTKQRLLVLARL